MEIHEREALVRFARDHHVHYEVEPEAEVEPERRERAGIEVRLFATHGESKLAMPGCPTCVDLLADLRSFAERLFSSDDTAGRAEIIPVALALYQSTEVPGADEVAVAVRLPSGAREQGHPGGGEGRLRDVRERLHAIGVPQR